MDTPDIRLEEKIAFVERHVEELDSVVRDLHEQLTALRKELSRLRIGTTIQERSLRLLGMSGRVVQTA